MICYFCRGLIGEEEHLKPIQVGFGKHVHVGCLAHYRDYLKQVVAHLTEKAKKSEVF